MGCEWPVVPIGSVAEVFDGPHATPTKTQGGPVFLGISTLNRGRLDMAAAEHLSEDDYLKWTRRVLPRPDDVVFSYETRLGEAAIIPVGLRCCLGRRMALVRPDARKLLPHYFLYYYFSPEFQDVIRERTIHGSTVDRLLLKEFPGFPIRLPPLEEQEQTVQLLRSVDARIDNLRATNATLEAIARALFKSWFVDFDPVHAKAEGRAPAGMDAATAALFPSEFEDSELAPIPKGWRRSPASELFDVGIGKTPPRKESQWFTTDTGDVPWVSIRDMGRSGCFIAETSEFLTRDAVDRFNVRIVPAGTVLMSFKLTVGRLAITGCELTTNEAIAHFKSTDESPPQTFLGCVVNLVEIAFCVSPVFCYL